MVLIPIFLILSFCFPLHFHENLLKLAEPLHNVCLSYVSREGDLRFIYRSLICGESLLKNSFYESLRLLGLLHLMVISGTHMLFLDRILSRSLFFLSPFPGFKKGLILFFLFFYSFVGFLKPPIVRAFFSLFLNLLNQKLKLGWPKHQRVLLSGSLCLMLFPNWWTSYSLILSWAGSLALSLVSQNVKKELFCFLLLYPLLLPLAPQSPVSLFSNWLFAPFLTLFLFPLTLVGALLTPFRFIVDFIWRKVEIFLHIFTLSLPPLSQGLDIPIPWAWIYLITWHFVIYFWVIYERK